MRRKILDGHYCTDECYKKKEFKGGGFAILPDFIMPVMADMGLKPLDRLVYLCLYHHADVETGKCYPSYNAIKSYTGSNSNTSIKHSLDRLEGQGLITFVKKGYYDPVTKENRANTYKVNYVYPIYKD